MAKLKWCPPEAWTLLALSRLGASLPDFDAGSGGGQVRVCVCLCECACAVMHEYAPCQVANAYVGASTCVLWRLVKVCRALCGYWIGFICSCAFLLFVCLNRS